MSFLFVARKATLRPLAGGNSVAVTGTDFTGATAVYFGDVPATSFTVNSDGSISAVAPAADEAETVDVTVVTPFGTSEVTSADQYTYVAAPATMGISPSSGSTAGGLR